METLSFSSTLIFLINYLSIQIFTKYSKIFQSQNKSNILKKQFFTAFPKNFHILYTFSPLN